MPFKNVIYDYPLGRAMADGFVKEPAVVTRKNFNPAGMSPEEIERLKLEDGVRLHESVKVELETYARETGKPIVKPFLLVIARDTTHAGQLLQLIQSDGFFEGRYKDKVIQVDSSRTGAEEDEMIERLLKVEQTDEPTEIVIHVNMLKEGWDVTNLYTIVPLRAANARILIEQSIGRGLAPALRQAHRRYRRGPAEHRRPRPVPGDHRRGQPAGFRHPPAAGRARPGPARAEDGHGGVAATAGDAGWGSSRRRRRAARRRAGQERGAGLHEAGRAEGRADRLRGDPQAGEPAAEAADGVAISRARRSSEAIVQEVAAQYRPAQLDHGGRRRAARHRGRRRQDDGAGGTADHRHPAHPGGAQRRGAVGLQAVPAEAGARSATRRSPTSCGSSTCAPAEPRCVALGRGGIEEARLEDYIVSGLVDFDDISYDDHADLLYDLAGQTVRHFRTYLSEDDTRKVLRCYQRDIARFIHAQMQEHYWEEAVGYEVKISKGFTELKHERLHRRRPGSRLLDFRESPHGQEQHGASTCSAASTAACTRCRSSSRTPSASWR